MADEVIVSLRADISDIQKDLNTIRGQMSGISNQAEQTAKKTESAIGGAMKSIGPQILAAFSVGALISFGKQILQVTGEFQKLEAVLTNTLGSRGQAQQTLKQIQEFAAKTNFGVQELTASYVKLANQGFKPTINEMRKLADLANSTGKSFDQLTEAIIDAQTGEFERLKEFGIRAKKEGDNVTFAFKGVETQTKFTNEAIREYVLSLGDLEGVLGSTEAISKTLTGQISNLDDAWKNWLNSLGTNTDGIFSGVISGLSDLLNFATRVNDEINNLSVEQVKVAGKNIEIFKFQRDEINKNLDMILEVEKASIDAVKQANSDAVTASDKATAQYQKSIAKRLELNKISLELIYGQFAQAQNDPNFDKAEEEKFLRQIFRYEEEKRFLETELPKSLSKYRDESIKNIKVKEVETKEVKKQISAYDELVKKVGEAEKKIKDNAAKGIFNEKDIDNVSKLQEELKKVNEEIALQTLFFEKQATIAEETQIPAKGITDTQRATPEITTGFNVLNAPAKLTDQDKNEIIDTSQQLGNTLAELDSQLRAQKIEGIEQGLNAELEALDKEYKAKQKAGGDKLKLEEEYQDRVKELNDRANAQIRAERIKQFNIDKALAIANITIDTAQAITRVLGTPGAPFLIPIIAGLGATQLAIVSSQQPPKYEKGGLVKGRRHSFGGVLAELEGGEYIAPIHATSKYLPELEAMRNNSFERLKEREWIQPALKKARDEYDLKLYKALHVNASLNDQNLIISDMKTRDAIYELIAVTKQNNKQANWRFRNV